MKDHQWAQRALLFADGDHGSAVQIRQIGDGVTDTMGLDAGAIRWTTIIQVWSRKDHHDYPGTTRWYYNGLEYPDFNDASAAWRSDDCPAGEVDPQAYLEPSRFRKADSERP